MKRCKEIIKPILRIGVFGILFCFMFITLSYIMKPPGIDLENIAGFYGEEENTLDMVYIGGSASFVYYQPLRVYQQHGMTSYDFGANTIQAETYKMLVKEILKKQDPEVIVIDARAFQYRDVDQPPTEIAYRVLLTGLPYSWNRFQFIQEYVPKKLKESTLSYHFDLLKYHTRRNISGIGQNLKMMFQTYQNPVKGFYFVPKVDKIPHYDFATDTITPVSGETTEILMDLLDFLKTTEQQYLFVVSPYSETKEHKENFNYVEKLVTSAGYQFLDTNEYYEEMNIDFDNDFYNTMHMNIYGSEKYTDFLYQYLEEHYSLPDHRGDPKYESWNQLLEPWNQKVEETKEGIEQFRKQMGI